MRRLLVAAVATLVVLGALVGAGLLWLAPGTRTDASISLPKPPASSTAQTAQLGAPATVPPPQSPARPQAAGGQTANTPLAPVAPSSSPVAPSFDVVRVAPDGSAVIAGRAAPGAHVTVKDGDKELGTVTADSRGEWVLVPSAPLIPGGRTLSLAARIGDGPAMSSEREVVLVVPERQKDIAGQPSTAPSQSLALSVPRTGTGPSTVLQAPQAPRPAAAGQGQVTVDIIDYDKDGKVVFAGKAQPEGQIRLYLDNRPIGQAQSGGGDWRMIPDAHVPAGTYTLRADLLGSGDRVIARIELPFQRAEITPDALAGGSIVVQPGNSLWRIARRAYGAGVAYTVIYTANAEQIRDPDLIYPGQVFQLPTRTN